MTASRLVCFSLVRMSESIGFCRMHHTVGMLWRRVDREKFQSFIPSVSEIMFRSGWRGKYLARADVMRLRSNDGLDRAFDKIQNLVNSFVDFPANVFTGKNTHQDHLSVGGLTRLPITFLLLVNSTTRTIKGGARTPFNTAGTTSSLHRCPHSLAIDPAASRPPRPHKISLPAAACLQGAAPHARFGNGVSCRTREHRHAQHPRSDQSQRKKHPRAY
jgi:hypothetical protein